MNPKSNDYIMEGGQIREKTLEEKMGAQNTLPTTAQKATQQTNMSLWDKMSPESQEQMKKEQAQPTTQQDWNRWLKAIPMAAGYIQMNPNSEAARIANSPHIAYPFMSALAQMGDKRAREVLESFESV